MNVGGCVHSQLHVQAETRHMDILRDKVWVLIGLWGVLQPLPPARKPRTLCQPGFLAFPLGHFSRPQHPCFPEARQGSLPAASSPVAPRPPHPSGSHRTPARDPEVLSQGSGTPADSPSSNSHLAQWSPHSWPRGAPHPQRPLPPGSLRLGQTQENGVLSHSPLPLPALQLPQEGWRAPPLL